MKTNPWRNAVTCGAIEVASTKEETMNRSLSTNAVPSAGSRNGPLLGRRLRPWRTRNPCMTLLRLAAAAPMLAMLAGPSQALEVAYVSAASPGATTCGTFALPCRDFQSAIDHTDPGGTIIVLTSGDYGGGFISKSLTITATGVNAIIKFCNNFGAFGVDLEPGEQVTLRGLIMDCKSSNTIGLSFGGAGSLHVQDSLIRGYYGVSVSKTSVGELHITDSTIADSGYVGPQAPGLMVEGPATVTLDRVRFIDNNNGVRIEGGAKVLVRDSVISGTPGTGLSVARGRVLVEGTSVTNGGIAVHVSAKSAVIRLSHSTITGNATGLLAEGGGRIISSENNVLRGNGRDGAATGVEAYR